MPDRRLRRHLVQTPKRRRGKTIGQHRGAIRMRIARGPTAELACVVTVPRTDVIAASQSAEARDMRGHERPRVGAVSIPPSQSVV